MFFTKNLEKTTSVNQGNLYGLARIVVKIFLTKTNILEKEELLSHERNLYELASIVVKIFLTKTQYKM